MFVKVSLDDPMSFLLRLALDSSAIRAVGYVTLQKRCFIFFTIYTDIYITIEKQRNYGTSKGKLPTYVFDIVRE